VVNLSALLCCCSFTLEQVRDSADDIKDIEKQERTEKELRVRAPTQGPAFVLPCMSRPPPMMITQIIFPL
jgi:hypothetical protein